MVDIIHELGKKEVIVNTVGCDHETLEAWYNDPDNHHIIKNFDGFVEIDESILDEFVPEQFPNRLMPSIDEETEPVPRTWKHYTWIQWPSVNSGKVIVKLGYRELNHGICHLIPSEEFYLWADFFGIENIHTKSCFGNIVKQESAEEI